MFFSLSKDVPVKPTRRDVSLYLKLTLIAYANSDYGSAPAVGFSE